MLAKDATRIITNTNNLLPSSVVANFLIRSTGFDNKMIQPVRVKTNAKMIQPITIRNSVLRFFTGRRNTRPEQIRLMIRRCKGRKLEIKLGGFID